MECVDAESETEKHKDDSLEKSKLLNDDMRENGDSKYDEGSNLRIPLTVLDDSGIGSSLSQLKEDAGLGTKSQNQHGDHKSKDSVSFQHEEAFNHKDVENNTQRKEAVGRYKDLKPKYLNHSGPENLFDTPPNSLVCNILQSVSETTTERTDSLNSIVVEEKESEGTNRTECDGADNLEEDTSSDSTLVSSSQNGNDTLQNADSLKKLCAKSDKDKYNPTIPVQQWSPVKEPNNKEISHNVECHNEGRGLPPEQWTPTKLQKQQASENDSLIISRTHALEWGKPARTISKASEHAISRKSSDRKKYTFEEIIQIIEEKIQGLLMKVDFCVPETRADLKFIQRQTRYSSDVILNRRVVDRIVKMGIAHVFLKVWQSVSNVDYLHPDKLIVFKNLQAVLSIIWNCTDKSSALCESLVKCGVVQLLVTELATVRIRTGDYANENTLYLVKAYLGILHNVARLCADSRKLFRSSNAVEILKLYLGSEQGLVKTKAYLILSYIINEEENGVINATHDHLNYIIGILREALSSENHYAKTTAFWANEIADGLNHLAVNDANKVRMGQLGVIQLYLKLLQSDSMEEQSLGTAGTWILAFCDENKHLISKIHGFMETLYALANNSPHESIRRCAHGAIWVLKRTPERPTIEQVKEADIPHVMISYNWSAQQTMMKVRNRLKAAGYKVWMDIDNMSGSTLQAMALAVERAAVVLICMSQVYKDSASCRTEAEYTYSQRKDIIPILLQQGYVPDGWLGALVGTRIYFDLTDEGTFHCQIDKLIREIGNRGRMTTPKTTLAASAEYDEQRTRGSSVCSDLSLSSSTSSLHSYKRIPTQNISVWNHGDIRQWLASHQLGHVAERFEGFTGEVLLQYKSMMKTAPEYFYSSLDTKLRLDLVTSLKFAKALNAIDGGV